jgi:hypothetical protein
MARIETRRERRSSFDGKGGFACTILMMKKGKKL